MSLRKSHKQPHKQPRAAADDDDSAPEEVATVDAKALVQQDERKRTASVARASQRAADVKQRRRDVAQQRTAQAVAKRKARAAAVVVNDDDDVEEEPTAQVAPPARKPNHQFLSDEIIAELARQEDERDGAADVDEERARTDAKRRKVKRQSRQVSTNLEVRVLPRDNSSTAHKGVAPEILAFKQKHFFGDRVKRVDERTLSRRRGPMPLFNIEKK